MDAQRGALALNPNDPDALAQLGWRLAARGNFDEGIPYIERAIARSANPPGWYFHLLAVNDYLKGDYAGMLKTAERSAVDGSGTSWSFIAIAQGALGHAEEARAALDRWAAMDSGSLRRPRRRLPAAGRHRRHDRGARGRAPKGGLDRAAAGRRAVGAPAPPASDPPGARPPCRRADVGSELRRRRALRPHLSNERRRRGAPVRAPSPFCDDRCGPAKTRPSSQAPKRYSQPFFLNRQNSTRQIVAMPVTTIG